MAKKTIFITGGAGVLGGALIECLAKEYNLICLTRLGVASGKDENCLLSGHQPVGVVSDDVIHVTTQFTFLDYTFRPRKAVDKYGRCT